ncbi:hypothetical protein NHX12_034366, partial [Muraenolepis orangiensis]
PLLERAPAVGCVLLSLPAVVVALVCYVGYKWKVPSQQGTNEEEEEEEEEEVKQEEIREQNPGKKNRSMEQKQKNAAEKKSD